MSGATKPKPAIKLPQPECSDYIPSPSSFPIRASALENRKQILPFQNYSLSHVIPPFFEIGEKEIIAIPLWLELRWSRVSLSNYLIDYCLFLYIAAMRAVLGASIAVLFFWTMLTCANLVKSSPSDAVCWPESVKDLLLQVRDNHCLLHGRGDSINLVGIREVVSVFRTEYHFAIRLLVNVDPAEFKAAC